MAEKHGSFLSEYTYISFELLSKTIPISHDSYFNENIMQSTESFVRWCKTLPVFRLHVLSYPTRYAPRIRTQNTASAMPLCQALLSPYSFPNPQTGGPDTQAISFQKLFTNSCKRSGTKFLNTEKLVEKYPATSHLNSWNKEQNVFKTG